MLSKLDFMQVFLCEYSEAVVHNSQTSLTKTSLRKIEFGAHLPLRVNYKGKGLKFFGNRIVITKSKSWVGRQ